MYYIIWRVPKSASNIFARYQDAYVQDNYGAVLIFCDTDKAPYREYRQIKEKVNQYHNAQNAAHAIIIYANPCTMQIILSHFDEVSLKNQGKKTNSEVIERLTGVCDYDAHQTQIDEICNQIFWRTYQPMKDRIFQINLGDTVSGSSNFIEYLNWFESEVTDWIEVVNNALCE